MDDLHQPYDPTTMGRFRTARVEGPRPGWDRYQIVDRATGRLLGEPKRRYGDWGDHVLYLNAPHDPAWDSPMARGRWATIRDYMEHRIARDLGPEWVPGRGDAAAAA